MLARGKDGDRYVEGNVGGSALEVPISLWRPVAHTSRYGGYLARDAG